MFWVAIVYIVSTDDSTERRNRHSTGSSSASANHHIKSVNPPLTPPSRNKQPLALASNTNTSKLGLKNNNNVTNAGTSTSVPVVPPATQQRRQHK